MTYNLVLTNEALADIDEHALYLSGIQLQLGLDFLDEVEDVLLLIESNPKLYQIQFDAYRRGLLEKFNFQVWYEIIDDFIMVSHIPHGRRNTDVYRK